MTASELPAALCLSPATDVAHPIGDPPQAADTASMTAFHAA